MKRLLCLLLVLSCVLICACVQTEDKDIHVQGEVETAPTAEEEQTTEPVQTESIENEPTESFSEEEGQSPPVVTEPTEAPIEESESPVITGDFAQVVNLPDGCGAADGLGAISYSVADPGNSLGLSCRTNSFSFGVARDGAPHSITVNNQQSFDSLDLGALAWDNKSGGKVLYLTFDCGYEYGNLTSLMLDTLSEKGVSAAFFCTLDYLRTAPEVVLRMIDEGHIVGNHSTTHPSDCSALTREEMAWEILGVHNYLRCNFDYESRYFRFPAGVWSESALDVTDSMGYRSVFWSIAYADWDPEAQVGEDIALETVCSRLHDGAVILLHSTSPDNAAILGDFIDYAHSHGYEFRTLDEYGYWS